MLARRTLSMVLCLTLAVTSGGICMASADRLAQETQAVREAGQQETSPLSGEEKEVVRETEPETAEAAQETQEPEGSGLTEEQEEEDTRCLHEFTGLWVGYECKLTDYADGYEPGD